jgi:catechol-2,3-dioxygenase
MSQLVLEMLGGSGHKVQYEEWSSGAMIESISAVTLATHNMARAVAFYRMLGFEIRMMPNGESGSFT